MKKAFLLNKNTFLLIPTLLTCLALLLYSSRHSQENKKVLKSTVSGGVEKDAPEVLSRISDWPDKPRTEAQKMIKKYGEPDEITSSALTWHNKGIWKKTVIYKEETEHYFPTIHSDFIEQSISYQVPKKLHNEITDYNGSITIKRTEGLLSSRCNAEEINILSLNLVHDMIRGKSAEEARQIHAKVAREFANGENPPYTQKLQFIVPRGNTADPDKVMILDSLNISEK